MIVYEGYIMSNNINELPDSWTTITTKPKKSLGRGLQSLLGKLDDDPSLETNKTDANEVNAGGIASSQLSSRQTENIIANNATTQNITAGKYGLQRIPIALIAPNPLQPRREFTPDEMEALARSIQRNGMLQPILLRPLAGDNTQYQIVAGERRWRAAQMAMLDDVPALIRDLSDKETLEWALIENLHREDLNIIEEATAYQELINTHYYTQQEVADVLNKSRSHINNMVRLLKLPADVQKFIHDGDISFGHARILAASDDPTALAHHILQDGLSVRQAEQLLTKNTRDSRIKERQIAHAKKLLKNERKKSKQKNQDIIHIEQELSNYLGLHVDIAPTKADSHHGKITLHFNDLDQFESLITKLKQ